MKKLNNIIVAPIIINAKSTRKWTVYLFAVANKYKEIHKSTKDKKRKKKINIIIYSYII